MNESHTNPSASLVALLTLLVFVFTLSQVVLKATLVKAKAKAKLQVS